MLKAKIQFNKAGVSYNPGDEIKPGAFEDEDVKRLLVQEIIEDSQAKADKPHKAAAKPPKEK